MPGGVDVLLAVTQQQLVALQAAAVDHPWLLFCVFIGFHAIVFFGSQALWRRVTACRPQVEAPVLASSTTAATHGLVATLASIYTLSQWDWQSFDEVNTPAQTLLMLFSTAYFVEDTWYCATLPADAFMYTMHHVVTAAFVASPLLGGRGGIAICFGLFTGEVTNGLFHSYLILEQFAKVSPRAATAFRWVAAVFTTVFVIVRSVLSWPAILWYWRKAWGAVSVPYPHRLLWCTTALLVSLASQGFAINFVTSTRKLWLEHAEQQRQRRQHKAE
ncbi:transmembrane 136 isoform X1 [Chlorella sorokiniana]|uniref:Transmembrane 136 isoform X1 n=1 Tax=Chlorella sorokiniana TaxID=3076 RepID=A0A2P6TTI4_CHLSO|nr:transmembrane 136 isoform X1 [Chlorella sorokiniana]|eukprot:PRW57381.1 transmembrane 136 isoform X1 [Chlorella sorokiniana]